MFMYPNKEPEYGVRLCSKRRTKPKDTFRALRKGERYSIPGRISIPLISRFVNTLFRYHILPMCHRANRAPAFLSGHRLGGAYSVKVRKRGVEDVERREQAPALRWRAGKNQAKE